MEDYVNVIKLQVPAGKANPAPPIGPVLGQHGVNIAEFCKKFNDQTKNEEAGTPLPVTIYVKKNKSFVFEVRKPPVSFMIKKAAGVEKGSTDPGLKSGGTVSYDSVEEIAKQKMEDMGVDSLKSAISSVMGTARSMGMSVSGQPE